MQPAGQDSEARSVPGAVTLPLRSRTNASPFWIMLLLVWGRLDNGIILFGWPNEEQARSKANAVLPCCNGGPLAGGDDFDSRIAPQQFNPIAQKTSFFAGTGTEPKGLESPVGTNSGTKCPDERPWHHRPVAAITFT